MTGEYGGIDWDYLAVSSCQPVNLSTFQALSSSPLTSPGLYLFSYYSAWPPLYLVMFSVEGEFWGTMETFYVFFSVAVFLTIRKSRENLLERIVIYSIH